MTQPQSNDRQIHVESYTPQHGPEAQMDSKQRYQSPTRTQCGTIHHHTPNNQAVTLRHPD